MNTKKVLVIGGAGFIGSNFCEGLELHNQEIFKNYISDGTLYSITVLDDLSTGTLRNISDTHGEVKYDFVYGTMLDKGLIFNFVKDVDCVVLFGAWARVQRSVDDVIGTSTVNIDGVLNVLEAIRQINPKCKLVYSSSSSVYGDQGVPQMVETMSCYPLSPYALQKYTAERYCMMYRKLFGLDIVALRYFNVYGKNQLIDGMYSLVIGKFLKQRGEKRPLTIYGDGEQTRAYTEVRDVVNANVLALKYLQVDKIEPVFNIGTNVETSVNDIAKIICGGDYVEGVDVQHIIPNPRGEFEEARKSANYDKALGYLRWEPTISIEDGIKDLL